MTQTGSTLRLRNLQFHKFSVLVDAQKHMTKRSVFRRTNVPSTEHTPAENMTAQCTAVLLTDFVSVYGVYSKMPVGIRNRNCGHIAEIRSIEIYEYTHTAWRNLQNVIHQKSKWKEQKMNPWIVWSEFYCETRKEWQLEYKAVQITHPKCHKRWMPRKQRTSGLWSCDDDERERQACQRNAVPEKEGIDTVLAALQVFKYWSKVSWLYGVLESKQRKCIIRGKEEGNQKNALD